MEKIEKISEKIIINMKDLKEKFEKAICETCKKEFNAEVFILPFSSRPPRIQSVCNECKEVERKKIEELEKEKELIRRKKWIDETIIKEIPKKYRGLQSDRKDLIDKYMGKSLFITGETGVGKTVLMADIAQKVIMSYRNLKWISYPAFIMGLQDSFKKDRQESLRSIDTPYELAENTAKYEGWLCIDDIGAEKLTDYVRQITYFIINEREQRMLPTIITSNFTLAQIDEMIDSRISSRIAGMCEMIKLIGKDRRIKNVS